MNNNTTQRLKSKIKTLDFSFVSLVLSFFIVAIMLTILFSPTRYAQSITNGIKLFFCSVLPGLLPFMFLTKLLTNLGVIEKLSKRLERPAQALFGVGGNGLYAFLMSAISGYPIGSKITADLYKNHLIDDSQATKIAILSSTSGPIFVIGAVGGAMLNSTRLGFVIYISNILAVILCSFAINIFSKKQPQPAFQAPKKEKSSLYSTAKDIVLSLLVVGFYIALFSLLIDLLNDLKILPFLSAMLDNILGKNGLSAGIMSGIVEMTNGAKLLSASVSPLSVSLIGFVVGFGGLSISMQSLSFLSETKIKARHFLLAKLFQATLTFLICLAISSFVF